jgi:hypothetical protein
MPKTCVKGGFRQQACRQGSFTSAYMGGSLSIYVTKRLRHA